MSAVATAEAAPAVPVAHAEWHPRANPWLIAGAVMLATFMEVLDTSIASVALPYIAGNLGATQDQATWVLTSYLVSNAIILPTSAWFASRFGRKRFLICCICIFTLASFACGAASSLGMLIFARVLQGAGGGALQPLSQAILLESFPPNKRGAALALFGLGVVCAPILGPTLGGWLTDDYSWRWAFFINIPVGALAVFLISLLVEDPPYIRAAGKTRIDIVGLGFMAIGLAALQITLDKGQEADWFSAVWIRWLVGTCVVSLVCFVWWELYTPKPIVDLRVLKNRNFAIACTLFGVFGAQIYAMTTLQPLFLQSLLGYTALDAGLTVSPRGAGSVVALFLVGALMHRISPRALSAVGFGIFGLACFMLSRITLQVSMSNIVPANLLLGFGLGFIFVPLSAAGVATLRNEQIGNASGIQNLLRNIGGGIGISYVTTMLERHAQRRQFYMVGHLSPLDPVYQQRLAAVTHVFAGSYSPPDALQHAQAQLYNVLLQQANYWAYVQLFFMMALVSAAAMLMAWLLKKSKVTGHVALE